MLSHFLLHCLILGAWSSLLINKKADMATTFLYIWGINLNVISDIYLLFCAMK